MKYFYLKLSFVFFLLGFIVVFATGGCKSRYFDDSGAKKDSVWLFVSFKDPGDRGIWLALSCDGKKWAPANKDQPVLVPDLSKGKMRDPFIVRGPENKFHILWTSGRGRIGHAVSTDLVHWSDQQIIPILRDDPRVLNTWAPEMIFDQQNENWRIFWSSTIKGDFPETVGQVENEKNHRIYSMTTADFKNFSDPVLFFDPGYPVIDATIMLEDNRYNMVFKDERRWPLHKQLRTARSSSLDGPWVEISEPITVSWTEGPTLIRLNGKYVIYYDHYEKPQHMKAIQSDDFRNWKSLEGKVEFPPLYKHGSFLKISQQEYERLKKLKRRIITGNKNI